MADPPRLRSQPGSLESLLLRSSPGFEPPPEAEQEVWRRLEVLSAVGAAAGATAAVAQTAAAAGSKLFGKALWLMLVKWGVVLAIGVPAVGLSTRWALHSGRHASSDTVQSVNSPRTDSVNARSGSSPPSTSAQTTELVDRPATELPKPAGAHPAHGSTRAASSADSFSALRAESQLLGVARAKLAGGDLHGALDDVARLGAQFPRGRLVQEREVVAIDCLTGLGEKQTAETRALAFLERFPGSPYAAHVRQLVAP